MPLQLAPVRNVAMLYLDPGLILAVLKMLIAGRNRVVMTGLPADARLVGEGYDPSVGKFYLRLESESLEPVAEGAILPRIDITFINPDL